MQERYVPEGGFSMEKLKTPEETRKNGKFKRIFRSVGNSGAKAATLCCMSEVEALTAVGLWNRFREQTGWNRISKMTPSSYIHEGFLEAGLVIGDEVCQHDEAECTTGFRLTEFGALAKAYAAHVLSESAEFPYPLNAIFGHSGTNREGSSRGVENRALILEVLANLREGESLRTIDIADKLGISAGVVGGNLRALSDISRGKNEQPVALVKYESVGPENPGFAKYTPLKGVRLENVKTIDGRQALTEAMSQLMFERGVLDAVTAAVLLKDKFPNIRQDILEDASSHILSGLAAQGISYPLKFIGKKKQSEANITDLGREVYDKFIKPLRDLLNGNPSLFEEWQKIFWQEYAGIAVKKHFDASSYNNPNKDVVSKKVLDKIGTNPGVRPVEIERALGIAHVGDHLRVLLERGEITKIRSGRKASFYLK